MKRKKQNEKGKECDQARFLKENRQRRQQQQQVRYDWAFRPLGRRVTTLKMREYYEWGGTNERTDFVCGWVGKGGRQRLMEEKEGENKGDC